MPETLASLRAERHHRLLCHTARQLLFDWRAAAEIMEQTWQLAADNLHRYDPASANLGAWVCCIRDRLTSDYVEANGYTAPLTEDQIRLLDLSEEEAAAIRERRAGLTERINALPPMLREAGHTWLAGRPIDPATGVRVRVALNFIGRRPTPPTPPGLEAIDTLPKEMAAAVRAVYLEDRSFPDAAKALGCSVQTAYQRTRDGIRHLRRILAA